MMISTSTQATDGTCDVIAVSAVSAQGQTMRAGATYRFIANTNCWIRFGSNPTAVAQTDGNIYVSAGEPLEVFVGDGTKVAVVRDTADGFLSQTIAV